MINEKIKKDFNSHLIVSTSPAFSATLNLNEDLIDLKKNFEFQKSNGIVSVFKLK